jgi:alpha-mannosidase
MGYYASRPELKALHFSTSRLLLATETFSVISENIYNLAGLSHASWSSLKVDQGTIDGLWDEFVPSTHHDYVTGTSTDYVTYGEQLPLSRKCSENASTIVRKPITAVIDANAKQPTTGDVELYAWNSLGFARAGIYVVEGDTKALSEITGLKRVQKTWDGKYLAYVDAPSLGFKRHSSTELRNPLPAGTLKVTPHSGTFFRNFNFFLRKGKNILNGDDFFCGVSIFYFSFFC